MMILTLSNTAKIPHSPRASQVDLTYLLALSVARQNTYSSNQPAPQQLAHPHILAQARKA